MNLEFIIQDIDDIRAAYFVSLLCKTKPNKEVIFSIKKEEKNRIAEFLKSKRIALRIENGKKVIESIILGSKVKIKDARDRISGAVVNRFNVAKSYVATTKKTIVDKCKAFYMSIKNKVAKAKLIFDISKETNLQKSLQENSEHAEVPEVAPVVNNVEPSPNIPTNQELPKIVINSKTKRVKKSQRVLNLRSDFCQKVNEGISGVIRIPNEMVDGIRSSLGLQTIKVNAPKKLVRVNGGFISTIAIAVICIIAMGILSYIITSKIIG